MNSPVANFHPAALWIVGLRAAALALTLGGQQKIAEPLYALADAAEAGHNVDAHMALVAEKLRSRSATADDWSQVAAAIEADSERLGKPPAPG